MSNSPFPSRPNLEFYRKQAMALLKAARDGDANAISRFAGGDIALHKAQLAIARENGFASWPLFRAHLPSPEKHFRPHVRGFKWYEERVAGMVSVHRGGLPQAMETIRSHHPRFAEMSDEDIRAAAFSDDDARLVLAREHGFERWEEFKTYVDDIEQGKRFEPFTAAFEAINMGDVAGIAALIQKHPDLLDAQGTNGSSLLNLAVSLKQLEICRLLIEAGTDVDLATTRGVTPLHQAAYGNKVEFIELLIEAGASLEAFAYGDGGTPLMMALFWGHDAARGAIVHHAIVPDNLRAAAGVGRLDLVQHCFRASELTAEAMAHRAFYRPHTGFPVWNPSNARQEILDESLTYAARNGQVKAMEFLLRMGADINGDPYRGTALIWAVHKGRVEVIEWLLDHGAEINRRATFGGPTHGQGYTALHAAAEKGRVDLARLLIERGADGGIKDDTYHSPPCGWAEHFGHLEMRDYLRAAAGEGKQDV